MVKINGYTPSFVIEDEFLKEPPLRSFEPNKLRARLKQIEKDYLACISLSRNLVRTLNPYDVVEVITNQVLSKRTIKYTTSKYTVLGFDQPRFIIMRNEAGTRHFKFTKYQKTWWVVKFLYHYSGERRDV